MAAVGELLMKRTMARETGEAAAIPGRRRHAATAGASTARPNRQIGFRDGEALVEVRVA